MIDTSLVIVSNRQPYRHAYADEDEQEIVVDQPGGGVVAGLDTVAQTLGATWIAWGDGEADPDVTDAEDCVDVPADSPRYTLECVWLDDEDVTGYYEGYANRVLWPLAHCRTGPFTYDQEYWERYLDVNRQFANRVLEWVEDGDTVWFQDYHFAIAPAMVNNRHDGPIIHFWHIPWPSSDVFQFCPQRREIVEGLLGNDLLGFHIDQYGDRFLECVNEFVPDAVVDHDARQVRYDGRITRVDSFPLGVDVQSIQSAAEHATGVEDTLRDSYGIRGRILLGVDRLDYTKGIPERVRAIEHLLEQSPELRETFTYVQKTMESRDGIPEYQMLQAEVESAVERVNGRFATSEWQPIVRIDDYLPETTLYGLYRAADVMLVTPICDGMNLVAQEFVAAQDDRGVLVLSEFAGVHEHLGSETISVNPFDTPKLAAAIERGLQMEATEREARMGRLRERVNDLDIGAWPASMLGEPELSPGAGSRITRPG